MGFLNAASLLTGLLVTAGAASVPVLIHILNRRRFLVVDWAAMLYREKFGEPG